MTKNVTGWLTKEKQILSTQRRQNGFWRAGMDTAEVVVTYTKTALSDADIEFGRKLWHELSANPQFPVMGVLWLLRANAFSDSQRDGGQAWSARRIPEAC